MGRQRTPIEWLLSCLALVFVSGCGRTVTYMDPSRPLTWETLNRMADVAADSVVVTLSGGEGHPARDPRFDPDQVRWTDLRSGEERSTPTAELGRISFQDRGRGMREGARNGLVLGGTLTVAAMYATREGDPRFQGGAFVYGLAATGVLMLVGAAVGGADAGWEDVFLPERPESSNRPLSEDPPQDTIAGDEEESQ